MYYLYTTWQLTLSCMCAELSYYLCEVVAGAIIAYSKFDVQSRRMLALAIGYRPKTGIVLEGKLTQFWLGSNMLAIPTSKPINKAVAYLILLVLTAVK